VLFLVIATLFYPGGSILDENSVGFDWSKNFFSNLFLAKALNGTENPSRIWALIGMVFNSIGYGLFFIHTSRKIPHKHTALVLISIGVVNMIFTFLIATPLHDIMVTVSSTLTMIGLFYITVFILKTKIHWLTLFCILSLLIFYSTLYLYGAGNWGLLAVMQKVTFLCFMLLVLTIEYFTKAEDFQQNKTDRVRTTTR
jgi:peptidoglycan biosynthesis protein MviN/MurJ (putative lipid II flippase)